jgi:dTDP-4-dehydrorhamnose reductase
VRVLITGATGQVGGALCAALRSEDVVAPTSATLDIADPRATEQIIAAQPEVVIHPAAWTDVDGCARDPERAYLVNSLGTRHVALACRKLDIPLVYISTNEVFDGASDTPYREWDQTRPINAYARSKLAGEFFVRELVPHYMIVRIVWVFGGARNFVRTILRLAAERPSLRVVADEIGNPTFADDVADGVRRLIDQGAHGTFHLVNEGYCSRFEFAREILRQAGSPTPVEPITLAEYSRASTPPPFGALHNTVARDQGVVLPPWQDALARFLAREQLDAR